MKVKLGYGVTFNPHVRGSAIAQAASLQFIAARSSIATGCEGPPARPRETGTVLPQACGSTQVDPHVLSQP